MTTLLRVVAWFAFGLSVCIAAPTLGSLFNTSASGMVIVTVLVTACLYVVGGLVTWALLMVCAEVLDFFERTKAPRP